MCQYSQCLYTFSLDASHRKKSKKKKRKSKDIERSSGDSDSQYHDGPEMSGTTDSMKCLELLTVPDVSLSLSGIEADSEGQESQDSKCEGTLTLHTGGDNAGNRTVLDAQVGSSHHDCTPNISQFRSMLGF